MSKPKPKHRPPSSGRLYQSARRFDFDATEEPRETIVFLPLKDHEFQGLKKLARRKGSSLAVEIHRAIDTHLQSAGQPQVQLLNTFLDRLNTSFNWHNKLLEEAIRKAMNIRVRRPRQGRSTAGRRR